MVAVCIKGGLGNQMFQFAAAYALSKQRDDRLFLDTTDFLYNRYHHGFELPCFPNIEIQLLSKRSRRKFFKPGLLTSFWNYFAQKNVLIQEPHFHFDRTLRYIKGKNIYLDGYWQSEKYFIEFDQDIRHRFTFPILNDIHGLEYQRLIDGSQSVSIHIRRGDYVTNPEANKFHGTCTLDYYHQAKRIIMNNVKNPIFFIFSDDTEWAHKNFSQSENTVIVDKTSHFVSWIDMFLMSRCKHNIIANSTFSWWAAWLNSNREKIVIAPKTWFRDPTIDTSDLYPAHWIRI
jgi:hypothetical protein